MKKATSLIRQITAGKWAIHQPFADAFLPTVAKLLQGEKVSFYDESIEENELLNAAHIYKPSAGSFELDTHLSEDLPEHCIGVLQLRGVVMKEDFCGVPGTASLMYLAKEMAAHPKIGSIVFVHDSGGGAVDGTFELADAIAEIAEQKPVIGFVDGLSASASYAILSQSTKLFASHKTAEIGSIGVCVTLRDFTERLKQMGVEEHYINATTSADKNNAYLKAKKGDYKELQEETLDPLHAIFKETVKRGQSGVDEKALTGKVYLAEKATELGLIEGIATLEEAINEAYKLSIS